MKLLFDENLSPRLPPSLADCFPGSQHVYEIQLDHSDERLIWGYARENGFRIVSRDSDLVEGARAADQGVSSVGFGLVYVPQTESVVGDEVIGNAVKPPLCARRRCAPDSRVR